MSIARIAISNASFGPDALKLLGRIFDEVWAGVAPDFCCNPDEMEAVWIRLATIILDLAKDGQLGAHQIVRTASRLIRQTSPKVSPSDRGLERDS